MSHFTKIAAILLVLFAILLGLLAYRIARAPAPKPATTQVSRDDATPQPTHSVIVAAKAIEPGQTLTAAMLSTVKWPVTPSSGFSSDKPLLGKVVKVALKAGDPVTRGMLARGLATYLQEGERAVTIPVSNVTGVTHAVAPGDLVDVFFTLQQNQEVTDSQTRLLLSRVRVLAYGDQSVDGPLGGSAKAVREQRAGSPQTAVLAVPLARVNDLLLAVRRGTLQLALRAPKDDTVPDVALFPAPKPVLQGRDGLTPEQKQQLDQPENLAYAGASLPQLAASGADPAKAPPASPAQASRPAARGGQGRTVQIIRADKASVVPY